MELIDKKENKFDKKRKSKIVENDIFKKFKSNISNKELFKQPTAEELNQLRETEILFNSNLFRLQTEELLKEVALQEKKYKKISTWIENFEHCLMNLTDVEIKDTQLTLKGIKKRIVKNNPLSNFNYNLDLILTKPITVQAAGMYNVNALTKPISQVDLIIVISKSYFLEKDYLNMRYFIKRALYLSYIYEHIKSSNLVSSVSYSSLYGNTAVPILIIVPNDINKVIFNVRIVPEDGTFKYSRFLPDKNNVRSKFYKSSFPNETAFKLQNDDFSTPYYNWLFLNDITFEANDKVKKNLLENLKGAKDGLILLNIWLLQRGLTDIYGGFNEDLMYSLMSYLIKNGRINKHMSSYQVIRNVWSHLASSEWNKDGIFFLETDRSLFHKYYDVVFMDASGHCNLAGNLNLNIYLKVKTEAKLAISYLDDGKLTSFQALFVTKMPFYLQFDSLINITFEPALNKIWDSKIDDKNKVDYLNFKYPLISKYILSLLEQGLTDRVTNIVPLSNGKDNKESILFGINMDHFNMYRIVEKGPEAYDPAAKTFQEFWGERTELRRFKDGSISEAVYWPCEKLQEKRKIFKHIITYVLESKLSLKNYSIFSNQFDAVLQKYTFPAVEEANLKAIQIFDGLSKILRSLELPLGIGSIQGISDVFSHTNPYPPTPNSQRLIKNVTRCSDKNVIFNENSLLKNTSVPDYVQPIECIIEMTHTTKWPDDLQAISYLKAAFYIQISKFLYQNGVLSKPNIDFLEVLYEGLVFRFVIFHQKQISLLKKQWNERGSVIFKDTEESIVEEFKYVLLPKITGALNGLNSQYPSYGASTALAKRWLNSQLIDTTLFPNVAINLLSALIYLEGAPFQQPALPQLGFLHFLNILAHFDFNLQPIILNFNSDLSRDSLDEFECDFQQNRDKYPPLCIVTPYDKFNSVLTQTAPSLLILNRLHGLAIESLSVIQTSIQQKTLLDIFPLFKPNLSGYDVLIDLFENANSKYKQSIFYQNKNVNSQAAENESSHNKIPITAFNPVSLYLEELRENYGDFALFFNDSYGGNVIAVLWKPEACEEQLFKLTNVQGKKFINEKLQLNKEAIIEDFYILGSGVVKNITLLKRD